MIIYTELDWLDGCLIMFNLRMLTWKTIKASMYLLPICLNTRAFLTKDTEENLAWVRYWIICTLLFALEILLDLHQNYFPCYDYFKLFLLWLCIVSIEINLSGSSGGKNLSQV